MVSVISVKAVFDLRDNSFILSLCDAVVINKLYSLRYGGGNNYNPQPIPDWQKGINSFFKVMENPQPGETSSSNSVEETSGSSLTTGEGSSDFPKNGVVSDNDDS